MASCSKHPSPQVAPRANNNPEAPHSLLQFSTIFDAIDDLCSRFINNLPEEELMSAERLCFQVEQAHWYYEDFIREENPHFSHVGLKRFTSLMFNRCPLLKDYASRHDETFEHFMQYKTRVPVCGAIMLNSRLDKCVLVKGWKASSGWGFPKGKINQQESPANCAIREVLEETGYNIADKLVFDQAIELSIQEQHIVLFLIRDVPEDFEFKTRTRKEISAIEWWHLADLPTWKTIRHAPRHAEGRDGKNKFYLVTPFVG